MIEVLTEVICCFGWDGWDDALDLLATYMDFFLPNAQPIGFKELMTVWLLSTVWIDAIIAGLASVIAYRLAPIVDRFRENYR